MTIFHIAALAAILAVPAARSDSLQVNSGLGGMVDQYLTRIAEHQWSDRTATIEALQTPLDVAKRQRYIHAKILEALGGFPETRTALNAHITGSLDRDGYRVEKLIYESLPHYYVTANLYVPTVAKGPFPAVLGTAGHSDDGKAYSVYQRGFIGLAKRGFIVLAYDPPDQGERKEYLDPATGKSLVGSSTAEHTMSGLQCLLTGGNVARYELWDGIRGVDYLLTRDDVDPKRIAVVGNSGGGTQSAYMAVVEPRLAAAVPSCYITSWEKLWPGPGPQDAEQDFTNFLKDGLNFSDFLIAFAPKPIEMLTAIKDFFPIEGARATYAEAHRVFSLVGKEDHVGYFEYNDGHGWSKPRREATYAWLEKWLLQRNNSVPEPEFDPEPAANLNCTRTGQVATSLKSETVQTLNQQVAETIYLHRRAANLKSAATLRDVITNRLEITTPHGPSKIENRGEISRDGYRIEKVSIETEPNIVVPMLVFVPLQPHGRRPTVLVVSEAGKAVEAGPGGRLESLVRAGYIVIAPDLRGLGESRAPEPRNTGYTVRFQTDMRALLVGKTMAGMQVYDLLSVFGYASARSDVDASRISLIGNGTAGVIGLYAAAIQPRVKKVVLENSVLSYMDIVRAKVYGGLTDLVVPGVLRDFDLPDVAKLIGPKKVVIVNPQRPNGSAMSLDEAALEYGPDVRIEKSAAPTNAYLQ